MLVIIEQTLTGKFVVSKAQPYQQEHTTVITIETRGCNVFGQQLDPIVRSTKKYVLLYQAGEALSAGLTQSEARSFVRNNGYKLLHIDLHKPDFCFI